MTSMMSMAVEDGPTQSLREGLHEAHHEKRVAEEKAWQPRLHRLGVKSLSGSPGRPTAARCIPPNGWPRLRRSA